MTVGDEGHTPRHLARRRRRVAAVPWWLAPLAAGAVAVAAGSAALVLARDEAAEAVGIEQVPVTPVLSARRAPEAIAAPVADRRLADDLRSWLASSPERACLAVERAGHTAFEHNPLVPLAGASTQKLLTATGLLLALGPDATFRTEVVAEAAPAGGVVDGDLYLVGGGPADLGTPNWPEMSPGTRPRVVHDIDDLVDAVVAAGVTRVEGSVVGDGSRYDDDRYNDALPQRLIDQDQVGPVGGLVVNDGFAAFSPARTNAATVPAADPAADAARVLTERLEANGVAVTGAPRTGDAPEGAAAVAGVDSPPLSQLVAEMLSTSDNEAAEAGLKEIAVASGREGSWAAGAEALAGLLGEAGVSLDGIEVVDGSGLTNENRLTCRALVDVLTLPESGPVVRAGLAVAGESGTLIERWVGTDVAGRLRAKTGTLRDVTALAGEIDTVRGGSLTFAYIADVDEPDEVSPEEVELDDLAHVLVAYPRDLDVAALGPEPPAPTG
ncbi:MAG TPA: D-alanyl-D-alanine carboxypeptidase/D-alanyl-D-alanine-endopeptidase [Acidimicrobiales bacterium]